MKQKGPLNLILGKIIRARRIMLGLKIHQFAERADLSPAHVTNIERGYVNPSIHAIVKLANALGLSKPGSLIDEAYAELNTETQKN